jgi:hypothetical protein
MALVAGVESRSTEVAHLQNPCSRRFRRGFASAARFVRPSDVRVIEEYRLAA